MITALPKMPIGEILIEDNIISREQLARALAEQKATGQFLGELLVARGLVSQQQLVKTLARRLGVRGCVLQTGLVDPALLNLVGEDEALHLKALPMFRVRDTLTVAMAEPQSLPAIDRLRQLTNCSIRPVLVLEGNVVEFIKKLASSTNDMTSLLESVSESELGEDVTVGEDGLTIDLDKAHEKGPVVNLVHRVILKSIHDRASDIHIEPDVDSTRIRCRIDGVLSDLVQPAGDMHAGIVSRVKVMSRMDIAEKRLPQEGRLRVIAQGRQIDLRVSSMPTLLGEKIVIRILDKANLKVRFEDLGFRPDSLATFQRILRQPYGMVLVTGPTGSGKTTTLYSALDLLRSPEVNIVTVEDPVEYQLDLINQVQVQSNIGMTFARALRSILRQDPDIIMVGEIRDAETASVSVHAALTGHLVLATLHTNDAPGAIARLVDMGVEPYLLSGSLNGVVAQRLVRKVCANCATEYSPDATVLADAGLTGDARHAWTRGAGCDQCHGTGFAGRVGIYEVMEVTPALRTMIHQRLSADEFRREWQKDGGLTLRQEGLLLARNGLTSLEEVLGATHSDGVAPA
ncbi:MAG: ATPase, T2SS/T4P/T4SS family [Phycisphaerae bacterium]|nr:ATPase, T2SS/T4P/T4SS family [Phycisphaerae bacterium]